MHFLKAIFIAALIVTSTQALAVPFTYNDTSYDLSYVYGSFEEVNKDGLLQAQGWWTGYYPSLYSLEFAAAAGFDPLGDLGGRLNWAFGSWEDGRVSSWWIYEGGCGPNSAPDCYDYNYFTADVTEQHFWAVASVVTVPEPATLGLLLIGLALLLVFNRRNSLATRQ